MSAVEYSDTVGYSVRVERVAAGTRVSLYDVSGRAPRWLCARAYRSDAHAHAVAASLVSDAYTFAASEAAHGITPDDVTER